MAAPDRACYRDCDASVAKPVARSVIRSMTGPDDQIPDTNRTPAGVIIGYYEPLLSGNRLRGFPYIFPVHASPDDMLYLSERNLASARSSASIMARIEGRKAMPVAPTSARARNLYLLETGSASPSLFPPPIQAREPR